MYRASPVQRSTPLLRRSPLKQRGSTLRRTALKRGRMTPQLPPRRDWSDARAKVNREGRCRACRRGGGDGSLVVLEAAHVIGREHDQPNALAVVVESEQPVLWVAPIHIVPLCRTCHALYDNRQLDLLPFLTHDEQGAAATLVGLVGALHRISGSRAPT